MFQKLFSKINKLIKSVNLKFVIGLAILVGVIGVTGYVAYDRYTADTVSRYAQMAYNNLTEGETYVVLAYLADEDGECVSDVIIKEFEAEETTKFVELEFQVKEYYEADELSLVSDILTADEYLEIVTEVESDSTDET